LGYAEVNYLDEAGRGDHKISGLHIVMRDSRAMQGRNAGRKLRGNHRKFGRCDWAAQLLTVEELAGDVVHSIFNARTIELHDIGVAQRVHYQGFLMKLLDSHSLFRSVFRLQDLQSNVAIVHCVLTTIDFTIEARAQQRRDDVRTKTGVWRERHDVPFSFHACCSSFSARTAT